MGSAARTGHVSLIALGFALAGCGGGGGGDDEPAPAPAPQNTAPSFAASSASGAGTEGSFETSYTASATDDEGDAVSYSVAGGADASFFTIDSASGALSFASATDADTPQDADADNIYRVTISASDGSASSSQNVSITLVAIDDEAPVPAEGVNARGSEATTVSGLVASASDPDTDDETLTFSLGAGADNALFTIDGETGLVRFKTRPDFEAPTDGNGDNVYELQITVSDGERTAVQSATVTVADGLDRLAYRLRGGEDGANGHLAGFAIAGVDDYDEDGFPDVMVGAPFANVSGAPSAGQAFLVHSGAVRSSTDGLIQLQNLSDTQGITFFGTNNGLFGSLVAGDGNYSGDEKNDLLMAEPSRTFLRFAQGQVLAADGDDVSASNVASWRGNEVPANFGANIVGPEIIRAQTGTVTAFYPDMDEDDRDEVLVTSDITDGSGGRIDILFGSFVASASSAIEIDTTSASQAITLEVATTGCRIENQSVQTIADLDGDGKDELLLRIIRPEISASYAIGIIPASTLLADADGELDPCTVPTDDMLIINQAHNDLMKVGDLDGDGFDELMVETRALVDGESRRAFMVLEGAAIGGESGVQNPFIEPQDRRTIVFALRSDETGFQRLGIAEAVYQRPSLGDVTGDGKADLLVPVEADGGASQAFYLLSGAAVMAEIGQSVDLASELEGLGVRFTINTSRAIETVTTAGDLDGDGLSEILFGEPTATNAGGTQVGEVFLFSGYTFGAEIEAGETSFNFEETLGLQ